MSNAVPTVCRTIGSPPMAKSRNEYSGAKASADTTSSPDPAPQVGVGGCKHLLAAKVEAQQEQTCGLAEAPRIDSPQQTGFLAKPDVGGNETGKVAGLGHLCHRGIHGVDPEVGQTVGRIDEPSHIMPPLHWLKQEEHRCHEYAAVAPVAHNEKHYAHNGKEQEHIAGREEGGVERGETGQQHQASQEAVAKVEPPPPCIAALQIEGETEQEGENGIGLARKKRKHHTEHPAIESIEPSGATLGIYGKDEMLEIMNHDYGHDGKPTQRVNHLDTRILFC